MSDVLTGKTIVLGVTGSIAAAKAVSLASRLTQDGASVDVIMTEAACKFVEPLSFQAITRRPVNVDMFHLVTEERIGHVALGARADILVIAPATANVIARLATGTADHLLLTTALATRAPVLVAPAMEPLMYSHPRTQANIALLKGDGVRFVGPAEGRCASGKVGLGRMVEPADIVEAIAAILGARSDLAGLRVIVTAGGTQEPIDPVRFIGNRSSGKMGYAIAQAAVERGAQVTLISAPTALPPPAGIRIVQVRTAVEMEEALDQAVVDGHILVMAAAVSDFRVDRSSDRKIKRGSGGIALTLIPNLDLLAGLAAKSIFKVGFAAETEDLVENAREKLRRKSIDLIVANDVTAEGCGFESDTNRVTLVESTGTVTQTPLLPKRLVADAILDRVRELLNRR